MEGGQEVRNALRNVIGLLQRHQELLGLDGSVGRIKSFFSPFKIYKWRAFRLFLAAPQKPFRKKSQADLHSALIFLGRGQGKSFISSYFE